MVQQQEMMPVQCDSARHDMARAVTGVSGKPYCSLCKTKVQKMSTFYHCTCTTVCAKCSSKMMEEQERKRQEVEPQTGRSSFVARFKPGIYFVTWDGTTDVSTTS